MEFRTLLKRLARVMPGKLIVRVGALRLGGVKAQVLVNAQLGRAVMIQEAPGREISGGGLGGPVAKAVMEAVLR